MEKSALPLYMVYFDWHGVRCTMRLHGATKDLAESQVPHLCPGAVVYSALTFAIVVIDGPAK